MLIALILQSHGGVVLGLSVESWVEVLTSKRWE